MLCLFVASVTGVWLVFRQELGRAFDAKLRVVRPAATRLSEDDVVTLVEQRYPRDFVSLVQFPQRPDDALWVSLTSRDSESRDGIDRVYVNQYTAEILGERGAGRNRTTFESLDSIIVGLHHSLLADEWGRRMMGLAALVWLVTSVIGLALSWPTFPARLGSWIPVLSTRLSGPAYKANYRVHRASGLWLFPVLTMLAFTSVALNLTEYVRPIVGAFSPLSRLPDSGHPISLSAAAVTFDQAVAAATPSTFIVPETSTRKATTSPSSTSKRARSRRYGCHRTRAPATGSCRGCFRCTPAPSSDGRAGFSSRPEAS
jgi:uncharacterized iron-regulated membrane protein